MSYVDWEKLGYPPLLLSVRHVAEWSGLTPMAVNNCVKTEKLFRHDDGPNKSKIPTDHPKNLTWLKECKTAVRRELNSPGRPPAIPRPAPPASPPPSDIHFVVAEPNTTGEDMLDVEELLEALRTADYSKISAAAVQKLARIETALKTRVDREAKRGLLIDRTLVSSVFAKLYHVDSNELRTVAAKVTPDVCAELGIEDPETILKIEKCIDDEILKALAHKKRIMDDFLVGVGGEPVPTE